MSGLRLFLFASLSLSAFHPLVHRGVERVRGWLEGLSGRRYAAFVGCFAVVVLAHFLTSAWLGERFLFPYFHDEQMYLLQARMLASGYVALPQHPCAEFFDTFYVFVKPVYSSMYFPGTALAYVPAVLLGLPFTVWPLLITTTGVVPVSYTHLTLPTKA